MRSLTLGLMVTLAAAGAGRADTITLNMVPVGNPGNAADGSTGYGAVGYAYQIGAYDVTLSQYTAFLNAVAKTDTYGLYSSNIATDFSTQGISRSGSSGSYSYSVIGSNPQAANCPAFDVTWGDAARFCNWLQNGQPTSGSEGTGTTETGAYTLNGATSQAALMAVTRNAGASYFIPTENEWYKAAYYDPTLNGGAGGYWTYATKSNTAPSNVLSATGTNNANYYNGGYTDATNFLTPVGSFAASPSAYGTFDQSGDVWDWNEANISGSFRGLRGGSWGYSAGLLASSYRLDSGTPSDEYGLIGFRVAESEAVPEPGSMAMLLAGAVAFGIWRLRRNA
jgi:formylglycine-generating enzyme required for sulfatase activity